MNKAKIRKRALKVYEKSGQSAVHDLNNNELFLPEKFCNGCESYTPDLEGECLVCGQATTDSGIKYFIFGGDASRMYHDEGFDAVLKHGMWINDLYKFDPTVNTALDLLNRYDGNDGYAEITKAEYTTLKKKLSKRSFFLG